MQSMCVLFSDDVRSLLWILLRWYFIILLCFFRGLTSRCTLIECQAKHSRSSCNEWRHDFIAIDYFNAINCWSLTDDMCCDAAVMHLLSQCFWCTGVNITRLGIIEQTAGKYNISGILVMFCLYLRPQLGYLPLNIKQSLKMNSWLLLLLFKSRNLPAKLAENKARYSDFNMGCLYTITYQKT